MTQKTASQFLPIIQAWADGKTIQIRTVIGYDDWYDATCLDFNCEPEFYRIKPAPKLRVWKASEVPIPCAVRRKDYAQCGEVIIWTITHVYHRGVTIGNPSREGTTPFEALRDRFEYSTDGCKTWLPCGVLE